MAGFVVVTQSFFLSLQLLLAIHTLNCKGLQICELLLCLQVVRNHHRPCFGTFVALGELPDISVRWGFREDVASNQIEVDSIMKQIYSLRASSKQSHLSVLYADGCDLSSELLREDDHLRFASPGSRLEYPLSVVSVALFENS